MKIKVDENLPLSIAMILAPMGHDVDTSVDEQLRGEPDEKIWQAAQASRRFLITQDLDFSDIRTFAPGTHHGLLLLRLRLPGREALTRRITSVFRSEDVESWSGCFVIVTDAKVRIRRAVRKGER